jgi:arabinogalactan endo-1,4-beta-galactosidase
MAILKTYLRISAVILMVFFTACKKSSSGDNGGTNPPPTTPEFAKGADVSWLTQMENAGVNFYNSSGTQQDCLQILKGLGVNSIRLRAWINPADGWCNTTDVVAKAVRAKRLGMRIMIDFHYSDTWADPGNQTKPANWTNQDITGLTSSVHDYTEGVLDTLKSFGVTPEWVQIGNETNDGMLWPEGKASTAMQNFAQLVNAGYDAVKAVDTTIKVIVHLSNGYDNSLYRWLFDGLKNNGAKWDVIGMSLYPTASNWSTLNTQCWTNMNDMVDRYGKEVMVCEVGMSWDQPQACKDFLTDLIAKVKGVKDNKGLGVFYWEPEAYNNWEGYTLGAFDNSGKPTIALTAFN